MRAADALRVHPGTLAHLRRRLACTSKACETTIPASGSHWLCKQCSGLTSRSAQVAGLEVALRSEQIASWLTEADGSAAKSCTTS